MALVEEACVLSAPAAQDAPRGQHDRAKALSKAQEASTLERQLIRMQEQANLGDSHNLDLTFAVLCNLAGQYALNEMYTEALNTYQLLTRNKLFPHANRLKVNMGNIYFKMGEHPKALKLYRMALDQTPTAEKDLRMKVMHNIGLLLVRMGKFRDAVTNFQHIMHEQGDFQTGLHLVLCSVALNDAEGGKAAFHAMLDVEPPAHHQDIAIDDENDAFEAVLRDVARGDRLSRWSRRAAAAAERCLTLAAAALARTGDSDASMSWCVEALRGYEAGGASGSGAGARLESSAALASLRTTGIRAANGAKALQRLKAVARAHPNDRVAVAEANADAAFVAYALGNYSEASTLAEAACRSDPYCAAARVTAALAQAKMAADDPRESLASVAEALAQASHLDPADLIAMHDLALSLEATGSGTEGAAARWARLRGAGGAGRTLKSFASAGLARSVAAHDPHTAEHWYSTIGGWDAGVAGALARLHGELGDAPAAKHHYQDVEALWPCSVSALQWLGAEARSSAPAAALQYYRRAARLQPSNPQWGLLIGACLRASGNYQEALTVYKKMNARFPDDVQCLKLIVKLCGDQGLSETASWSRELQRAQARAKQQERATVPSAGSGSSGNSQSPIDYIKGSRVDSAQLSRSGLSTGSSGTPTPAPRAAAHTPAYRYADSAADKKPLSRSMSRPDVRKKKSEDFDDDLPLPPE
ncbi:intraflagellar transport protein 88 homolog isoform X1 [Plutella xylostella]|uniref:intraflagellar transport protein 88 homolog isoform X1 n=1 Tax=Plutella xylostella TaxID=51655 RepID=UPI0020323ECD|nr:intraflagellar transport protein 88 homolog isoform X1 [Plutella xylostella]